MKLLLQHKIIIGHIILMAVIGSMTAILLFDRNQVKEIKNESSEIRSIRQKINTVYRHITELSTLGESAIAWDTTDYYLYHKNRMMVDSLLQGLKIHCTDFVHPQQIDTLRLLLADKETHLYRIMTAFQKQEMADSIIAWQLPKITKQAERTKTIIRKRKGIAGWFGKKDTIYTPMPTNNLRALNEQILAIQKERIREFNIYTDSLRLYNHELNKKLRTFISYLDGEAQAAFQYHEQKIATAQEQSFKLIAGMVGIAIILFVLSHVVIQRDIRRKEYDRTKLEDALKQNKALSETRKRIIVTLSHDIRGPLNTISGSAELAMDVRDKKRRSDYLENILNSTRHIMRLVNNLLDLSRLNEAKETLNELPFRLNILLRQISEEYTHIANDKGLLFVSDFTGTDVIVKGDADRIEQIIDNLLTNAVKFTSAGTISLTCKYENGGLIVRVADTGIGMNEETISRIFNPFERSAPDTNIEGFGLGLSIVKGLINLLNGYIKVRSHIGQGSEFEVRLPLPETENFPEKLPDIPTFCGRLPQNAVILDDDPIQLKIIKEMLERNGVYCCTCSNAKEVVCELRKKNFDILLTDIQMPGTNGFGLLKLLRNSNIGNSRSIPVIAMTAQNSTEGEYFVRAGFSGCIHKPFSSKELLSHISQVMEPVKLTSKKSVDFSGLTSEISDKHSMLYLLVNELDRVLNELRESLSPLDREQLKSTVHRMFPVWEQLHISDELQKYDNILSGKNNDDIVIEQTKAIIIRVTDIISQARTVIMNNNINI